MKHYQILADEGWTHHEIPPNRYHRFFVALLANEHNINPNWQHSKNKDIQKLRNKAKYLISKNFDECNVFKDKL